MERQKNKNQENRILLESRLRYHLRCLREDATDPEMTTMERLMLVRDRARRIREIRREMEASYEDFKASRGQQTPRLSRQFGSG
jgi:hypothetical protein